MPKYRKKPVVIEAKQFIPATGSRPDGVGPYYGPSRACEHCGVFLNYPDGHGWIKTLEGGHIVCVGDWVITGVKGERYPCKPDIFEATYEPVEPSDV